MIKCPNGHLIPDDSRFCPDCGAPIKNEAEIRDKARHIAVTYKNGYDHYVTLGILPHFSIRLTIENCEKIISMEVSIIAKDNEIKRQEDKRNQQIQEEEELKNQAQNIAEMYPKGYDFYVKNGYFPPFSIWLSNDAFKRIVNIKSSIVSMDQGIRAHENREANNNIRQNQTNKAHESKSILDSEFKSGGQMALAWVLTMIAVLAIWFFLLR